MLILKGFTIIGAIAVLIGAIVLIPQTLMYLHNPPAELVAITGVLLEIYMAVLAIAAAIETLLWLWLAFAEISLRRERLILMGCFTGLTVVALGLFLKLRWG